MSDSQVEKLQGISAVLDSLTPQKLVMAALSGVCGISLYTLWEYRAGFADAVSRSPMIAVEILGVIAALAVIYAFFAMQTRLDRRTAELEEQMRWRQEEMRTELAEVRERERACNRRYYELIVQLNHQGIKVVCDTNEGPCERPGV